MLISNGSMTSDEILECGTDISVLIICVDLVFPISSTIIDIGTAVVSIYLNVYSATY